MRSVNTRSAADRFSIFAIALSLALVPSATEAKGLLLLNAQISHALPILIAAGSVCIKYTYDANGNRTAQTVTMIGAGQTQWGSGVYGCFLWSAP